MSPGQVLFFVLSMTSAEDVPSTSSSCNASLSPSTEPNSPMIVDAPVELRPSEIPAVEEGGLNVAKTGAVVEDKATLMPNIKSPKKLGPVDRPLSPLVAVGVDILQQLPPSTEKLGEL